MLTSRYILNVNDIFCTILTFIPCHYFTSNKELLSQNPLVVYHVIKHQIEKEGPYMIYYYSNPLRDVIFSFVNLKVFFLLSFFSWCKTTHVFLEMLIVVFVSGRHKFNISVKISEPTSYTSCTIPDWITSTYTSIMINSWRLLTTFHSIDLHNESLRIFD